MTPPLQSRQGFERLPCPCLVGMGLHQLLPPGADPSPVADEPDGPEQIPLDHEAIEAPDALLRLYPVQNEMVRYG